MGKRLTANEVNILLLLARPGYSLRKQSRGMGGDRFAAYSEDGFPAKFALPQTVRNLADRGYIYTNKKNENGYGTEYFITDDGKDRAEFLEEAQD